MVNYESAIKKPFTDVAKLIIGAIVSIIPIVNWIATGYALESSGLGKTKTSKKMPEWKNIGNLFIKGFASYVIGFVYALPALIVFVAGAGFAATSLMNSYVGTVIPQDMISSLIAGETSPEVVAQLVSQNWYLAIPTLVTLAPILLAGAILMIIARFVTPMAVLNYLKNKSFTKAFDIGTVSKKAFTMRYFTVWIVAAIVTFVATLLLSLIPWVGAPIAVFVSGVITYSMYGDVYRETKARR
ncbi:MAG: DUF4013 domain-containing protein [Candidatus Aenigmatarchaeota archaeon]